ncbi:hypothetical protein ES319_D01G013900v1 [Gossypium barbadense]|uniref:Secreted protein n=2 Tax=Gossypium TaxID=3633 RepID=A0A5J5SIS2_GOSBA|nr:hypothetical protein ES319_D01G013900v1 [Gossypium barbadense]PPD97954.1 hypothetical protein GOBAR_DD05027 [Gossypium barbadense]TYG81560.1 hypothetical protein ES288_D01G014900v1 [Gossypium darwinii]TYG81561.1 hypothetical protein ES288_D01G015000v1 [Gossypium darwinii]TYG81562.1 hypothetical protein ES288_D01G015100v1 [Gossypium darwinii]
MVKVPFVVFLLALVLSIQFVVGQDEEAIDEEVSREADEALFSTGSAKLVQDFKNSAGDYSQSVDGPTSGLADEIAASPKSEIKVATESAGGMKRKMA